MKTGRVAQDRREVGRTDLGNQGADFLALAVALVEDDAGVGIGRQEVERNGFSRVNAESGQRYTRFECRLIVVQIDPHAPDQPVPASPTPGERSCWLLCGWDLIPESPHKLTLFSSQNSRRPGRLQITLSYSVLRQDPRNRIISA